MACTDQKFVKSPPPTSPPTSPRSIPGGLQSPSRGADLSNIFVQMNEFSRLESPGNASPRAVASSVTVCPSSPRQCSTGTLPASIISNLHTVLSLPGRARPQTAGSKHEVIPGRSIIRGNFQAVVDDNKNCIATATTSASTERAAPEKHRNDDCDKVIPAKKKRISESDSNTTPCRDVITSLRQRYCADRWKDICSLNTFYMEHVTELFFLQNGGNLMDYLSWKKRPNTLLACYLRSECLDEEIFSSMPMPVADAGEGSEMTADRSSLDSVLTGMSADRMTSTPMALKLKLVDECGGTTSPLSSLSPALWASPTVTSAAAISMFRAASGVDVTVTALNDSTALQESIAELARQEAHVMEKITELRKKGLWSVRRLPKASEPAHTKAHWDYVLEEMQWLANDFAQERKWKKAGARKVARMVAKYFQDQQQRELKAERDESLKTKRIAASLAKMVREFWSNIEKVVQYKQQSRLDEKRKKALDMHLSFIVDQTEKYSTWLTEGLGAGGAVSASASAASIADTVPSSMVDPSTSSSQEAAPSSPTPSNLDPDDKEFEPEQDSSDDEETIEKDELEHKNEDQSEELDALRKESEMPLDELLKTLPSEIFETPAVEQDADGKPTKEKQDDGDKDSEAEKGSSSGSSSDGGEEEEDDGGSYDPSSDESCVDDEETLNEQEQHEETVDHKAELAALQEEENLPIEELLKRYGGYEVRSPKVRSAAVRDRSNSAKSDDRKKEESGKESEDGEEEEIGTEFLVKSKEAGDNNKDVDTEEELGTEFLVKSAENDKLPSGKTDVSPKAEKTPGLSAVGGTVSPGREITDIAADAMSIQPTGYTLETAHVKTAVPFLVKHSLREYQHVGLEWLATMYEHRLNGILADEMGLGKTIQTIALLAYLACDKGIWGPHLIVVPTSVMLNWEMELKKWCPAFKILTYYGSVKERKMKRQYRQFVIATANRLIGCPAQQVGWTKTNAFHICITSYKLVIQDHNAFRRKKWKYFILDEAQNIKNFKSQRWQTLLNFHSLRRLLLTGTPLQNNLMELWSLMHFLMPHVFQSHRDFKEWFSNPLTGMIEGSREYNESLVRRLHKVLRPFLLRRLKADVEKQMPKKYEHVVMCRLSKRQRFLYDDFMSQTKTKETLATGHFMSVINILMQLRKVCNHPDLFDPRPTVSPFHMEGVIYVTASLVLLALVTDPLSTIDVASLRPSLCAMERDVSSYDAKRIRRLATPRSLIVELNPSAPGSLSHLSRRESRHSEVAASDVIVDSLDADCGLQLTCSSSYSNFETVSTTDIVYDNVPSYEAQSSGQVDVDDDDTEWQPDVYSSADEQHRFVGIGQRRRPSRLRCDTLIARRHAAKLDRLEQLYLHNAKRCDRSVVYGTDVQHVVGCLLPTSASGWMCTGYVDCLALQHDDSATGGKSRSAAFWHHTDALRDAVLTPEQRLHRLKDVLDRFVFAIPPATAPRPVQHVSHPHPSALARNRLLECSLQTTLLPRTRCLHSVTMSGAVQFPELRLIQYDCGKLQTLDVLLRQLKVGTHRALIFTQMTRMLDVLESFLSFHGHRYLRLDGTTKIEQRQMLMERFNADRRIFCFILSTRSGGIGVNLTGADTVIFYDSDWNPTMDAQAQDRCHRIGQTRDVHIYRLISERTIEENILKKANEKRLLGNVAIEGGNFTTAFFKQQTIKDLFEEPSGLDSLTKAPAAENKDEQRPVPTVAATPASTNPVSATEAMLNDDLMEQALCAAEDETDIQAAKVARAEAKAELAEFDENIPWDERELNAKRERDEESKVEIELAQLDKELMPVERYAVGFLEHLQAPLTIDELQKAEEEVSIAKEEWELNHLKAIKQEEERRAEIEEDEMLYTSVTDSPLKSKPTSKASKARAKLYMSYTDWDSADESAATSLVDDESTVADDNEIIDYDNDFSEQNSMDTSLSFTSPPVTAAKSSAFKAGRRKRSNVSLGSEADSSFAESSAPSPAAVKRPRILKNQKRQFGLLKVKKAISLLPPSQQTQKAEKTVAPKISPQLKRFKIPKVARPQATTSNNSPMVQVTSTTSNLDVTSSVVSMESSSIVRPNPLAMAGRGIGVRLPKRLPAPVSTFTPAQQRQIMLQPRVDVLRHMVGIRPRLVRLPVSGNSTTVSSIQMPSNLATTANVQRFAADNMAGLIPLAPRPPTPILEKFGASVMNVSAATHSAGAPAAQFQGVQYGSRLSQIVSSISAATMQTAVVSSSSPGGTVQYIITTPGRQMAQQSASPHTTVLMSAASSGGGSVIYQLPMAANAGKRLQMARPTQLQNVASTLSSSAAPRQNFVLTSPAGEKQNFILLPTSNRQSFILAPASSVAQPTTATSQPTVAVATSSGASFVLPSGFTLASLRQPALRQTLRLGVARSSIPAVSVQQQPTQPQPIVNTVPILEKFALQLSASPPRPGVPQFEIVSGVSPVKQQVQQVLFHTAASSSPTSPQFVRFAAGTNLKPTGNINALQQRLLNHVVLTGNAGAAVGTKPMQTIDVSQLVLRQPLTVRTPYSFASGAAGMIAGANLLQVPVVRSQLGTNVLQVPGANNQMSTVIILDSRPEASSQNSGNVR